METAAEKKILAEERCNKVKFITCIIPQFAHAYKMNKQGCLLLPKKARRA
jgi:hypothetical protein